MTFCGLKLTHDGSIALIDGQHLVFCYEMEKLNNSPRYSPFNLNLQQINELLTEYGYSLDSVDRISIDGWTPQEQVYFDPGTGRIPVELAGYGPLIVNGDVLQAKDLCLEAGVRINYSSFLHVTDHISSAYCSSPMAKAGEDSFVLVWDGGMFPQLFYYHCKTNKIESLDALFFMIGNIYAIFAQHFAPFKSKTETIMDDLSVAGKVMAYIAKGSHNDEMLAIFRKIFEEDMSRDMDFARNFARRFIHATGRHDYPPEDVLYNFHVFIEQLLVEKLARKVRREKGKKRNLCFAGGSALNIKWNSAIRNSGVFEKVWVPPFPNDSGSAIGAACCEMIRRTGANVLNWDVYSGPPIDHRDADIGWTKKQTGIDELALLLFLKNEPIVFLNGRAELGPRALGNRSILAPATHAHMKQVLNRLKDREDYRPVAPICLEQDAAAIFDPGSSDPFMLFDHLVRPEWEKRIPAIRHLDGTARLQTLNESENPVIFQLLSAYKKLSGIPLLCNTSANYNGKGFFPDVVSAMKWGRVNYVWSQGFLYEKEEKVIYDNGLLVNTECAKTDN